MPGGASSEVHPQQSGHKGGCDRGTLRYNVAARCAGVLRSCHMRGRDVAHVTDQWRSLRGLPLRQPLRIKLDLTIAGLRHD